MAQVLAQELFRAQGLALEAFSCGVAAYGGLAASANAVAAIADCSLSLATHKSQMLCEELLKEAVIAIAMTGGHKAHLLSLMPAHSEKIVTLLELCNEQGDVADPFGGDMDVYKNCMKQIKNCIDQIDWRIYL